jgi:hypothetical protein
MPYQPRVGHTLEEAQRAKQYTALAEPAGAQTYQDGKYYKLSRGKLWCHDGFEWVLSTRRPSEITGVYE